MIIDHKARSEALDPRESFIVQAPAGAGKTELLTQRFLALLATVQDTPEEILAVTFTKKAAGEMRSRIVNTLVQAKVKDEPPTAPHELKTWQLAKAALAINDAKAWQLIENPNRLRIVTIDALCAKLVNKMPILSQVGGDFSVVEFANALYEQAAKSLLSQTELEEQWAKALGDLLLHLDNRIERIINLLVMLLGKRDQWLPYLRFLTSNVDDIANYFNHSLEKLIENHLQQLAEKFSSSVAFTLMEQANAAANLCAEMGKSDKIARLRDSFALPRPLAQDLPLWQGLSELLLTKDGSYRKRFDQNIGFLSQSAAKDKAEKAIRKAAQDKIKAVVEDLAAIEGLSELLAGVDILPDAVLSTQHLCVLQALGELLPVLVAHLQLIFQETGQIDFIEVNLRALNALGDELEPSEILLKLDYQLRHILIDEYQDTSVSQYRLFEKLVAGWQQGDGRTLFLVGDPMQSIYRFRGAEVSLFLHTIENGLGAILPKPLTLQTNFRSNKKVIEWINETFVDILPIEANKTFGGVPYSKAIAVKDASDEQAVALVPVEKGVGDIAVESVNLIMQTLAKHPTGTIAVLGRTRRHLSPIIERLKKLNIPFVAHEVDYLASRMHVIDCISLLRATTDLTDIISWYAILRAPWLGLSLQDILHLSQSNQTGILWDALLQFESCEPLSTEAKVKLRVWVPRMQYWRINRRRKPLHEWLRGLWLLLGGPQCYAEPILKDMDVVFNLISDFEEGGLLPDVEVFEERLSQLYADVANATKADSPAQIELLTLHKAKGLEFDTVIMPYLHMRSKRNDPALLLWFEYALTHQVDLLLAPYRFVAQSFDPLYRYVDHCITQKDRFEIARLLYVGATRAKHRLFLLGDYEYTDKGEVKAPPKGSFWDMLWSKVDTENLTNGARVDFESSIDTTVAQTLWRLNKPFETSNVKPQQLEINAEADLNRPEIGDFVAKCAGTVFHRLMQRFTTEKANTKPEDTLAACELALKRMGLVESELASATAQVMLAIDNVFSDEKGRWIMDAGHQSRQSEWALSYKSPFGVENYLIDCSFIDEQGIRWIIDYKLTHHQSLSEEVLKDETEKYRKQLEKYRQLVSRLEPRQVRCGLYFPLAKVFVEIENGVLND